jgi:uncharacterized protein (DUF58 family)
VRVFEGAPVGDWWILLDLDGEVQVGEQQDSTLEHSVILTASLADQGMRAGRSVGVVASTQAEAGAENPLWLPPRMSEDHRWEILRALALVRAGARPLAELLELVRPALRHRTSLIIITPAVTLDWIQALMPFQRRGVIATVLLFDIPTFGAPADMQAARSLLSKYGIAHEFIPSNLLNQRQVRPGQEGQWEWQVTPMGRAVPVQRPADTSWQALG